MIRIGEKYHERPYYRLANGFTLTCEECGGKLSRAALSVEYCVFCDTIVTITCPFCEQKAELHQEQCKRAKEMKDGKTM